MRSEEEVRNTIHLYGDSVKRICMVYLKNSADTEDIFQNVFIKYTTHSPHFESDEHEKAWILRVAINECKDFLKSFYKRNIFPTQPDLLIHQQTTSLSTEHSEVLEIVLSLPRRYREVIYLFYYEEYSAIEIATILNKNVNTVYTRLARGRSMLKAELGDEGDEGDEENGQKD